MDLTKAIEKIEANRVQAEANIGVQGVQTR